MLSSSFRAPSYKAIAMAILKNDHTCRSLGFAQSESDLSNLLMAEKNDAESQQISIFKCSG
jgi:predicted phosphoadenosine phosphosulfate sulfurtransferase